MENKISKRMKNKLEKRDLIIAAAEKLFLEKDFEYTSMDDVSREAGITKCTLYKYFNSKEDLFYAVAVKCAKQFSSFFLAAHKEGKNALEKIRLANRAYGRFYIDQPGTYRLMNYQPDNRLNCEASPNYREMESMGEKVIQLYMNIVEEGKTDGSINANLDTKMAVYFGFCASMGLLNMVSSMEKGDGLLNGINGMDKKEFLLLSMDWITDALKS